jgi:hypothetical protein
MDKTGSGQAYDIGCIGFLGFKCYLSTGGFRRSILDGTFFGPTFFLSLLRGIAAILIMGML